MTDIDEFPVACGAHAMDFLNRTCLMVPHGARHKCLPRLGFRILVGTLLTVVCAGFLEAQEATVDFSRDVVPILQQHCIRCHRPDNRKGEVSLATAEDLIGNGYVQVGEAEASQLIKLITPQGGKPPRMPQDGPPLSDKQVGVLRTWITSGAQWPDILVIQEVAKAGLDWWSFQPVHRPAVPVIPLGQLPSTAWSHNPIDRFILSALVGKGLQPALPADRRTLIRRLSFDLLGLPPEPEAVEAFVNDPDPAAYEKLVDRFLTSPHYGERWARHWLDIAHYADTHGFERDQRRDNAWPYRDWVIQAFNADLPYKEFLCDQIAGDIIRPQDAQAVIATGYLAAGPWDFVGQAETRSEVLRRAARADDLDDMITQVMTSTCGVTINCARCHDHKLDPIPQRDYYALWAVFAGVRRGDREISAQESLQLEHRKQSLRSELRVVAEELAKRRGQFWDLADIVGGGDGRMTGKPGAGIDPLTGQVLVNKRGFVENVSMNSFVRSSVKFVDGVVIPDASPDGTVISSTGVRIKNVPKTSGQVWDAIRFGPVNSQFSTRLDDTDFATADHTLLSLHANAAITFDLAALRQTGVPGEIKFTSMVGYFGETPRNGASFSVFVDGELKSQRNSLGRADGVVPIEISIPDNARFLTLMATDGGNGIGHDQICFADPWLSPAQAQPLDPGNQAEIDRLRKRRSDLEQQLKSVPAPSKVYAVLSETPAPVKLLKRGDPEQPAEEVQPATLTAITALKAELTTGTATEGERRRALAEWITATANPLTRRVLVNRLWHYHFGVGLVDTPSDFGYGGGKPSHPELLDWLADEFLRQGWSIKSMHRLLCTSQVYQQRSSVVEPAAEQGRMIDAGNRLLWRMNPRRLDGESVRDAVLTMSGKLNLEMNGPGFRDFDYQEEYAPVYRYITPDSPGLWRRSVYRFIVRTTPHQFLTTLDCPSPANLVPTRNVTTTALQSLALLNNDFMLRQSNHWAARIQKEVGPDVSQQIDRVFRLAFGRSASPDEMTAARKLVDTAGLPQLCRMMLNANEFIYID